MKQKMIRVFQLLLVLWASALWATGVSAESGEKISISVGNWPPFFVQSEPGQGSVARLVRDVFAEQGYQVTFHFRPWRRAYREALNGRHDATAIWMHAEEREKDFQYSDPVMQEQFVLFHRKDRTIQWDTLQDLADLNLGTSMGYSYGPEFDQAVKDKRLKVEPVPSPEMNFRKLLYGRIDAFPEEINVGYYILRQETDSSDTSQITHHPRPVLKNESFLLFPRNDPDSEKLLAAFNRGLQDFRESGRYQYYFGMRPRASLKAGSRSPQIH